MYMLFWVSLFHPGGFKENYLYRDEKTISIFSTLSLEGRLNYIIGNAMFLYSKTSGEMSPFLRDTSFIYKEIFSFTPKRILNMVLLVNTSPITSLFANRPYFHNIKTI